MRSEFGPQQKPEVSSNAAEASAALVVSKSFHDVPNIKRGSVSNLAKMRVILTTAASAAIIACMRGDNVGIPTPTAIEESAAASASFAPTETPIIASEPAQASILSSDSEKGALNAEDTVAKERAEALFPGISFQSLQAEEKPIASSFTEKDGKWNGRPAQGYFFKAYKGQRLTTIAEGAEKGIGMDLESDVYSETGEKIRDYTSSRIEFVAPKTVTYYVIVGNDEQSKKDYEMSLKDRDVSDIVIKVRGADGNEHFLSEGDHLPQVGLRDFGFMVNPNDVVDSELVIPAIYALPGTKEEFNKEAFFPEDNEKNRIPTKVTRLDNGSLFVEPEDGLLPDGSQVVMSFPMGENSKYIYRIFTKTSQ